MALDFPANPTNGQAYGSYVYNSTVGAWQSKEDPATVAVTSPTAPTSANNGDIWYNSNTGVSYVYYADGSSAQWVEIVSSALPNLNTKANLSGATFTGNVSAPQLISTQTTGTAPMTVSSTTLVSNLNADLLDGQHASVYSPAGMVSQFAGSTAPTGWLLCDGTAISRTTYANLFTAIGTVYGTGDGSTTFNLPNLKGKIPVGRDAADTSFDVLGETGGAKTHTLTTAEMPSHTHTGTTDSSGSHTHTVHETWSDSNTTHNHGSSGGYVAQGQTVARGGTYDDPNVVVAAGAHTHTFTTGSAGSGGAHNNLQPYIVMNYIIKV